MAETTPSIIQYRDRIRLRTEDNRYVCLLVAHHPETCWLTLVDQPSEDCEFLIREYDYSTRKPTPFSGDFNADSLDSHGNVRFIHVDTRPVHNVGDSHVLSVHPDKDQIYWGVGWGPSDRNEAFAFFDANEGSNDGQVYDGSRVVVRSLIERPEKWFWYVVRDETGNDRIRIDPEMTPFIIEKV